MHHFFNQKHSQPLQNLPSLHTAKILLLSDTSSSGRFERMEVMCYSKVLTVCSMFVCFLRYFVYDFIINICKTLLIWICNALSINRFRNDITRFCISQHCSNYSNATSCLNSLQGTDNGIKALTWLILSINDNLSSTMNYFSTVHIHQLLWLLPGAYQLSAVSLQSAAHIHVQLNSAGDLVLQSLHLPVKIQKLQIRQHWTRSFWTGWLTTAWSVLFHRQHDELVWRLTRANSASCVDW